MSEPIQNHSPSACPMLIAMVKQLRRSLRATLPSTTVKEIFRQPQCSVCGLRLLMEVEIQPSYPLHINALKESEEEVGKVLVGRSKIREESEAHAERLLKTRSFTSSSTTPSTTSLD